MGLGMKPHEASYDNLHLLLQRPRYAFGPLVWVSLPLE